MDVYFEPHFETTPKTDSVVVTGVVIEVIVH